jgi:small-conductance mechanosensitive channel
MVLSYQEGLVTMRQKAIVTEVLQIVQEVKSQLSHGPETEEVRSSLDRIEASFRIVKKAASVNRGSARTDRNLALASSVLLQLINETEHFKNSMDEYVGDLIQKRNKLDSLLIDSALITFSQDSADAAAHVARLKVLTMQGRPTDSALNLALDEGQNIQNEVDLLLFDLKSTRENFEKYRTSLSHINLNQDFPDIWNDHNSDQPFGEMIRFSLAIERLAFKYYFQENSTIIYWVFAVALGLWFGIRSLFRSIAKQRLHTGLHKHVLLFRSPFASAFLLTSTIYLLCIPNAPFIIAYCVCMVQISCMFVIFKGYVSTYWMRFWIGICILFILGGIDHFMLQVSPLERWAMALLSMAGVSFGSLYLIRKRHFAEIREIKNLLALRYLVLMEGLALLLNIFGRYNLSKTCLGAGFIGVATAIIVLWVVRLFYEVFILASAIYNPVDRHRGLLVHPQLIHTPLVYYYAAFAGWFIIVGRGFYYFRRIALSLAEFLGTQRTVGNFKFSFGGISLFLGISVLSMFLAHVVSLFVGAPQQSKSSEGGRLARTPWASWLLLIRIIIISTGLFFAFASSGLPLDRLTIVFGALSVGIGLGLQSQVSNWVGGLIIAFERPFQMGDTIEISGKTGIVKSIGFRSSVLFMGDGSSLIVPNGELINGKLINWTSTDTNRRVSIRIDIMSGTDLQKVKSLMEEQASMNKHVLTTPPPVANARNFINGTIQFELNFWVGGLDEAVPVTNALIADIDRKFREEGIKIYLPNDATVKSEK